MFKLGIITDEVTQDFEEALKFAKKHELDCVELRSAWEKDPFELTMEDIQEIKRLSDTYEMPVYAISSPFYKCNFFDEEAKAKHMQNFKRVLEYADLLGVKKIRTFDFFNDEKVTKADIKKAYEEPIALCAEKGITLLIESEPSTNSRGSKALAEIVEYIDSPVVRALYEPGNEVYTPGGHVAFPEAFDYVKNTFAHVHVKDAVIENEEAKGVAVGSGDVDYVGIIKALLQMDYQGAVVLETHYKPNNLKIDEALLKHPKGSMFSFMGDIASEECLIALKEIIRKAQE